MTILHVPTCDSASAYISSCLHTLHIEPAIERREEIVANCTRPIVLLIEAVELAGAAGPEEEAVVLQFIRSIYAQAEHEKLRSGFQGLVSKLNERRGE